MFNILVLGGTGFVGRSVCEKLVERSGGADGPITVPSRHPARAGDLLTLPTVEVDAANLYDDAQLARLVAGRDAVINLVGILHGNDADFRRVHVDLPTRLARACTAAGVRRLVHVSALGADANAPSMYLRSKAAGEAALLGAGLDLTLIRPSVIFGEHDRFMNRFAALQAVLPVLPLAGANARFQPVWVEDVAAAIVDSLDQHWTVGQTIECVGPRVATLRQLVLMAGRWSGHARAVIALPYVLGRLQAALLELLPGEPLMSRDNLESMKVPNVASGKLPGLARFGLTAGSLDNVMPAFLGGRQGPGRLGPWRALAHAS
ncbi:complex I NDUFA9 subunit family protein [Piscinibacter sp.]|uniref:complex I NDUFA9 subunit family protein n=1 Tax=Piscinibacter sp. TaxID=1903157 RepID=UPI00355A0B65